MRRRTTFPYRTQRLDGGKVAEGVLATVSNVQKAIVIFVFVIDGGHEGSGWGQHVVDKNEYRLLRAELDALPNNVHKLTYSQVSWDKIPVYQKRWRQC